MKHVERPLACNIAVVVLAIEIVTPGRKQTSDLLDARYRFSVRFFRCVRR